MKLDIINCHNLHVVVDMAIYMILMYIYECHAACGRSLVHTLFWCQTARFCHEYARRTPPLHPSEPPKQNAQQLSTKFDAVGMRLDY